MAYTPTILTDNDDYKAIQSYLGCDVGEQSTDFPYSSITTEGFLGQAESYITSKVAAQAANGVPTVAQILANTTPAVASDKIFLKNAVKYYVAALFCNGATNAINVSVQTGEQNVDRGGIGTQWVEQQKNAYQDTELSLKKITNWKRWRTI